LEQIGGKGVDVIHNLLGSDYICVHYGNHVAYNVPGVGSDLFWYHPH
jgi:hypothetical protein